MKDTTMRVGFTGTRYGMSPDQKEKLQKILLAEQVTEFHHGDCIGADDQADDIALQLGIRVIVHPPIRDVYRAHVERKTHRKAPLIVLSEKDYIDRNHDIVDSTDGLIVAPSSNQETIRSGTWATYRYAKGKKPLIVLEREI